MPEQDGVRRYDPPRQVCVQHDDGRWFTGWQDGWVKWPDGAWYASVTYTAGVGERYIRSLPVGRVRKVTPGD